MRRRKTRRRGGKPSWTKKKKKSRKGRTKAEMSKVLKKRAEMTCACGRRWGKDWAKCSCGRDIRSDDAPSFVKEREAAEQAAARRRRHPHTAKKADHAPHAPRAPSPIRVQQLRNDAAAARERAWGDPRHEGVMTMRTFTGGGKPGWKHKKKKSRKGRTKKQMDQVLKEKKERQMAAEMTCACGIRWGKDWLSCPCGRKWCSEGAPSFVKKKEEREERAVARRRAPHTAKKADHAPPPPMPPRIPLRRQLRYGHPGEGARHPRPRPRPRRLQFDEGRHGWVDEAHRDADRRRRAAAAAANDANFAAAAAERREQDEENGAPRGFERFGGRQRKRRRTRRRRKTKRGGGCAACLALALL